MVYFWKSLFSVVVFIFVVTLWVVYKAEWQEGVSRQGGSLIRLGVFDGLRGVHWQGWNEMKKEKQ